MQTQGGKGQPEFLSFGALPRILSLSGHSLQKGFQAPRWGRRLGIGASVIVPISHHSYTMFWVFKSKATATSQVSLPNPEGAMAPTGFSNKSVILTFTAQGG